MALALADRVQESTTTTGTGTLSLSGALAQFQTFAAGIGVGNTTYYGLLSGDGINWETGIGTVGGSVGAYTLARTSVLSSSNENAAIALTGTSFVFCDLPASEIAAAANPSRTKFTFPNAGAVLPIYTNASLTFYEAAEKITFKDPSLNCFTAKLNRATATTHLVVLVSNDGGQTGYYFASQGTDGNGVIYRNNGTQTSITAFNTGGYYGGFGINTRLPGVCLMKWYLAASSTAANTTWGSLNSSGAPIETDSTFDLTSGEWSVFVACAEPTDIVSVSFDADPDYNS